MKSAAELFHGKHDWTAFSATRSDVEDRTRTINHIDITERKDERARSSIIEIAVSADGFLRYMVRAIAGTLLAVGREEIDIQVVRQGIEEGKRSLMMTTAPACGLTLLSVRYE
jgi:tRNA pseudouridine38-40 synthase